MVYPSGTTDHNLFGRFYGVIKLHAFALPELRFRLTETRL
jgi:hypothetical protein